MTSILSLTALVLVVTNGALSSSTRYHDKRNNNFCCFPQQWSVGLVEKQTNLESESRLTLDVAVDRSQNASVYQMGNIVTVDRQGETSSDFVVHPTKGSRCIRNLRAGTIDPSSLIASPESESYSSVDELNLEQLQCLSRHSSRFPRVGYQMKHKINHNTAVFEGKQIKYMQEIRQFRKNRPAKLNNLLVETKKRLTVSRTPRGFCHLKGLDVDVTYTNMETTATNDFQAEFRSVKEDENKANSLLDMISELECAL